MHTYLYWLKRNRLKLIGLTVIVGIALLLYFDYVNKFIGRELFNDDGKNVMMLFKAEWCGYCKKFKPDWAKLKREVEKDEHLGKRVRFREFDADRQEDKEYLAKYSVKSFPTLVFKDKNGNITKYESDERSVEKLVNFIHEHVA